MRKELGRHVRGGEKALTVCMPITCKFKHTTQDEHGNEVEQARKRSVAVSPALDSPYDIAEWKNHHWYRPQHIPPGLARGWSLSSAEKISLPDSDHAEAGIRRA